MRRTSLCLHAIVCLATFAGPALAENLDFPRQVDSVSRPSPATHRFDEAAAPSDGVNTWLIFGFTEGSDVGPAGERSLFQDSVMRFARRGSGAASWDSTWGVGYSFTDQTIAWIGGVGSFQQSSADARLGMGASGIGPTAGIKYQVTTRDQSGIGVALQLSSFWQRFDSGSIYKDAIGGEFRLIADWTLIPERWFAAINLVYQPQQTSSIERKLEREATVGISAAVSYQIQADIFLGGELRWLTSFPGYALSGPGSRALYAGPTIYFALGKFGYFGAAWAIHIAGADKFDNAQWTGSSTFEQQQFRLKAGFSF